MVSLRRIVVLVAISSFAYIEAFATRNSFPRPAIAGCGKSLPERQTIGSVSNVTIISSGVHRSYLVFIPPDYNVFSLTPLILSYHGGNRNASSQLELDQLTSSEFNNASFVVYPQGINDTWQGVPHVTTNDVQFTNDILEDVQSRYCIDPSHISATGKSDGGGFCNVLACDSKLSKRIAAFAPVSGAYYIDTQPCHPSTIAIYCPSGRKDIPILALHGGNDTVIPYSGGPRKEECLPSIPHFVQQWAIRQDLGVKNETTSLAKDAVTYSFGKGDETGLVELIYESNIGHDWPSTVPNADNSVPGHNVASYNATPIILDFFKSHCLNLEETGEEL